MKTGLIVLFFAASCLAAPAPPEIIVNNATMECSAFNAGDECTRCEIPEGWTSLGYGTVACPEGYSEISAARNCTPGRNERCCSEGHSGSLGECDGMAVNHNAKQCMFGNGTAPTGWETKPDGTDARDWQCPEGYGWAEGGAAGGNACSAAFLLCALMPFMTRYRS